MTRPKPELLAPAANLETALTAFDHGADAVYLGLRKFNARERADNFDLPELAQLLAHARKHGKKVHVTLNTLIKEAELPELAEFLAQTAELRPDALIVQDLGVLRLARDHFPGLPLHASTQMGIHNSAGVELAARLGASRVILERQTTHDELRAIAAKATVELEVFVHGALCCSLSGSCLFSSWMGGWSGNRGKCKQPCRRPYQHDGKDAFLFSTKDLCSLDDLDFFRKNGVASLKIEGRLRKPDYVKNVVSAYRLALDEPDAIGKARELLAAACCRSYCHGFQSKANFNAVVASAQPGVSGRPVGQVAGLKTGGFLVNLTAPLGAGDRVRVQPPSGDEGPALTVSKLTVGIETVKFARAGSRCFIPTDKLIPEDGTVYKIGEASRDLSARVAALPSPRTAVDLRVAARPDGLDVEVLGGSRWSFPAAFQEARDNPLAPAKLVEEFGSSASDTFEAGRVEATVEGRLFIPASVLKQIRRSFWEWLALNPPAKRTGSRLASFLEAYDHSQAAAPTEAVITVARTSCPSVEFDNLLAVPLAVWSRPADEAILPDFVSELELEALKGALAQAYHEGCRRFRATSLYALELLKDFKDITITTSYPLPACNSLAVAELKALAVDRVQTWIELSREDVEALRAKAPLPLELYAYGRPALLTTRAAIPASGPITGQPDWGFTVKHDKVTGLTRLHPRETLSLPDVPGVSKFIDLTNAAPGEHPTSTFNFNRVYS